MFWDEHREQGSGRMNVPKHRTDAAGMTKIALCAALLCISSFLVIPLPFTPIVLSMHTVMVNLIGLILKPRQAAVTLIVYLCMGLIGLPVFSGGTAGPGKLFGPTGGFYFGFLFAAIAISLLKGKKNLLPRYILVTVGVGIPIQHLFAVLFLCFYNRFNIPEAIWQISIPFLPGDILKCVLSSFIASAMNKVLPNGHAV